MSGTCKNENKLSELLQAAHFFADSLLNFVCFASCDETADIMERISTGLESVLNGVQPCIFPGELVVGYNFSDGEKQYTGQDPDTVDKRKKVRKSAVCSMELHPVPFLYKKNCPLLFKKL